MEGMIYEEVLFNQNMTFTYADLDKENKIAKGLFLPIQVKAMIEAGQWTCYSNSLTNEDDENYKLISFLDEMIDNGSALDDLYVEYGEKEDEEDEEVSVIFFVRHNIMIDNSCKCIFYHPTRFNEIPGSQYHDQERRMFVTDWDGLCEVLSNCCDYDGSRYSTLINADILKDCSHSSSFVIYWYWTHIHNPRVSGRVLREVRLIEMVNQHAVKPMSVPDIYYLLDKRMGCE